MNTWDPLPKITDYMDNTKKEITLWVLVDSGTAIVYTGYSKEVVENYKESKDYFKNAQVIELKGELNV